MGLRVRANIFRRKRAFVGVVSFAKLLVRRLPPCRTRCYAYARANSNCGSSKLRPQPRADSNWGANTVFAVITSEKCAAVCKLHFEWQWSHLLLKVSQLVIQILQRGQTVGMIIRKTGQSSFTGDIHDVFKLAELNDKHALIAIKVFFRALKTCGTMNRHKQ